MSRALLWFLLRRVKGNGIETNGITMRKRYCYWGVCTGEDAALMGASVRTARAAGIFGEFHVLTDRPIPECESYDAYKCDRTNGLHKLHYLKAGMTRLNFEYFVWIDPATTFVRRPFDMLAPMGRSPVHVPLELELNASSDCHTWQGVPLGKFRDLVKATGALSEVYLCGSAFWIVHHDVIDSLYDLAIGFWHKAKEHGLVLDVSFVLGFAMQMLCAAPRRHLIDRHPDLWASDYCGTGRAAANEWEYHWTWRHPLRPTSIQVRPAIVFHASKPSSALEAEADLASATSDLHEHCVG